MPMIIGMNAHAFSTRLLGLILVLLGLLSTDLARAQAPAALSFTDQNNIVAVAFDNSGNVTLRGQLLQGQAGLAKDPAIQEAYLKDSSGNPVAIIPLSGSAAGNMKLRGTLQTTPPSATHAFTLKNGSSTVASITSQGDLHLSGTLRTFNSVPANLMASAVSTSQIHLSWSKTGTSETGFGVERSPNGTDSWVRIATPTITSYDDCGLSAGTHYYYRVCAYQGAVGSNFSRVVAQSTLVNLNPPANLTAHPDLSDPATHVLLRWHDSTQNESGFVIERSTQPTQGFARVGYLAGHAGTGEVTYIDKDSLNPATTYYYRVTFLLGLDQNALTNVASATTAISPFFKETWDGVAGPYYPDAYPSDTTGTLEGTDQPDWQWTTLASPTVGTSFRESGAGYEFGRFDETDAGEIHAMAPVAGVSPTQDRNLYAGFDVTLDSTAPDEGGRFAVRLQSETDYGGAAVSAVSLWLDGSQGTTRFGALVSDHGQPSATVTAAVPPASGTGAKHYRIVSAIKSGNGSTSISYQVLDRDDNDRVLLSGSNLLNRGICHVLNQVRLDLGDQAHGGVDNISLTQDGSGGLQTGQMQTAAAINGAVESEYIVHHTDFHFVPYSNAEILCSNVHNCRPPIVDGISALLVEKGKSLSFTAVPCRKLGYNDRLRIEGPGFLAEKEYIDADNNYSFTATIPFNDITGIHIIYLKRYVWYAGPPQEQDRVCVYVYDPTDSAFSYEPNLTVKWVANPDMTGVDPTTGFPIKGHIHVEDTSYNPNNLSRSWESNIPNYSLQNPPPASQKEWDSVELNLDPTTQTLEYYAAITINGKSKRVPITLSVDPFSTCQKVTLSSNPVNLLTGAKYEAEDDLVIPNDGQDFIFGRQYDSLATRKAVLGHKWDTNWSQRFIMHDADADGIVDALEDRPNGSSSIVDADRDRVDDRNNIDPDPANPAIPNLERYPSISPTGVSGGPDSTVGYFFKFFPRNLNQLAAFNIANNQIPMALSLYHYSGQSTTRFDYYKEEPNLQSVSLGDHYVSPNGNFAKIRVLGWGSNESSITLYHTSGTIETYHGFHNPPRLTDGKLRCTADRLGHKIILDYDDFGRIKRFRLDGNPATNRVVSLAYWDDPELQSTPKANLLKSASFLNRKVEYDYLNRQTGESDGDLTSVRLNGERETRYDYYQVPPGLTPTASTLYNKLRHNLTQISRPCEVAMSPQAPLPYKQIQYYDDVNKTNLGLVKIETLYSGYKDNNKDNKYTKGIDDPIVGSNQFYEYNRPVTNDGALGLDKTCKITRHAEGGVDWQVTDYHFNSLGLNVKKVRKKFDNGGAPDRIDLNQDRITSTTFDGEGRVCRSKDEMGAVGKSEPFRITPFATFQSRYGLPGNDTIKAKYLTFMRRFEGSVSSSTLDCNCAGAGVKPVTTRYNYDPVSGGVREIRQIPGYPLTERKTTIYYDYMEAPYPDGDASARAALENRLAILMGITAATQTPTADDRALVRALLDEIKVDGMMNKSDLNGDGAQTPVSQVYGQIVRVVGPEVTLNPNSQQKLAEGSSTQPHIRQYQYDSNGHLKCAIDEAGYKTEFDYYGPGDPNGPEGLVKARYVHTKQNTGRTDPSVARTLYTYNSYGDLFTENDPRGVTTEYFYNIHGQPTTVIRDANDNTAHRLAGETDTSKFPNGAFPAQPYEYLTLLSYDHNGQLTRAAVEDRGPNRLGSDWLATTYQYDVMGRLKAIMIPPGGLSANQASGLAYAPAQPSLSGVDKGTTLTTSFYYDTLGRLSLKVYPAGNADYLEYDEFGRLTAGIQGIQASSLTATRQARLMGVTDSTFGNVSLRGGTEIKRSYLYTPGGVGDRFGMIVSACNSAGARMSDRVFDRQGQPILEVKKMKTGLYGGIQSKYDVFGNLKRQIGGEIEASRADSVANLKTMVNSLYDSDYISGSALLQESQFVYDELDRMVQVNRLLTTPASLVSGRTLAQAASDWIYNDKPSGSRQWISSRLEYDRRGLVTHAVDDDGSFVQYQYDGMGLPTRIERHPFDVIGGTALADRTYLASATVNTYDVCGNLVESDRIDYNKDNLATAVFRDTYFYDSLGRLVTHVDNVSQAHDYRYNSRDLLTAAADPNGPNASARAFQRRTTGGASGTCNNFGNVRLFYYDPLGRKVMDRQILTATGKGNGLNLGEPRNGPIPIMPIPDRRLGGGDGLIDTTYEYDPNGMLAAITDDNGNVTAWGFDSQNRPILEQKGNMVEVPQLNRADSPKAGWTINTFLERGYDAEGRLAWVQMEDDSRLTYSYYSSGLASQVAATRSGGLAGSTLQTFDYDVLGRMTQAVDKRSDTSAFDAVVAKWRYDGLGRLVEESQKIGAGPERVVSTTNWSVQPSKNYYSFNTNTASISLSGLGGGLLNKVILATMPSTPIAEYQYLGEAVLQRKNLMNGVGLQMTGKFDALGRPLEYAHKKSNGTFVSGLNYVYDRSGNVAEAWPANVGRTTYQADVRTFTYDSAGRLATMARPFADAGLARGQSWLLDGVGNWSLFAEGNTIENRPDDAWNATTAIQDLESGQTRNTLAYDQNGNLTGDATRRLVWDAFGRLYQVKTAAGALLATYRYDALGRRVRKELEAAAAGGGKTVDAVWSGWRLLEEHEETPAVAMKLARWFAYGNGLDEPLLMQTAAGEHYYYHQDALGSVAALTDDTGTVKETYDYDPYGHHVRVSGGGERTDETASAHGNPFLFAGRQWDAESGLYYNRLRYYDPNLGRFISTDPIGLAGGINLYEYVGGNPVLFVDPLGLENPQLGQHALDVLWKQNRDSALAQEYENEYIKNNPHLGDVGYAESEHRTKINNTNRIISGTHTGGQVVSSLSETFTPGVSQIATAVRLKESIQNRDMKGVILTGLSVAAGAVVAGKALKEEAATAKMGAKVEDGACDLQKAGAAAGTSLARPLAGEWRIVNEAMSARAAAYQRQITGRAGQVYLLDGVKFDGLVGNVLIDAKGPGYAKFVIDDGFKFWFQKQDKTLRQARAQIQAAKGIPIQWHFADADAIPAFQKLFDDNKIVEVKLVHTPFKP